MKHVVVLGAGSAGLLAALTLKRKLRSLDVEIVRDPALGVIGVGEGSTPNFVRHLFQYLGLNLDNFYKKAKPTWKLGIRFKWGPKGTFNYTFDGKLHETFKEIPTGYFWMENLKNASLCSAMMSAGKVFPRSPEGLPVIEGLVGAYSFHVENEHLVDALEAECKQAGVTFTDGKMTHADQGERGVEAIHLEDGRRIEADFFVDASGFRGELISGVLDEPFIGFDKTLFCDRAVLGGWKRDDEPILPYTTAEQMDCGWAWQIEHEHFINRGYVFCSDMISDEDAYAEFKKKNPKIPDEPRIIPFVSGYRKRAWVKNVMAIGNAAGFVEPLEASALMVITNQCKLLSSMLKQSSLQVTDTMRSVLNRLQETEWLVIRDFLGLHYKLNTAMDTPFWQRCRTETDLSGIQHALDFYEENGPSVFMNHLLPDYNDFGVDGFLAMLISNEAPCKMKAEIPSVNKTQWNQQGYQHYQHAAAGLTVKEALQITRDKRWRWQ